MKSYATPGSVSRHFLEKHVKKLKDGARIDCGVYHTRIETQIAFIVHAERFHGTVSRATQSLVPQPGY